MKRKRKIKPKFYKKAISRDQLKRCLFRFLKEFGYYSAYIRDIKPYCRDLVGWNSLHEPIFTDITFDRFLKRFHHAILRTMFPYNETHWDTLFYLWQQWAREEDSIDSSTVIV